MEDYKKENLNTWFHDVIIHLINGENIKVLEEVYIPENQTIFYGFKNDGFSTLRVTVSPHCEVIIPKDNILYISSENMRRGYEIWK